MFPKFGGAAFLSPESGGPGSGFGLAVVVVKDDYVTVNAVLYDTDLQIPQMELLLDGESGVVKCAVQRDFGLSRDPRQTAPEPWWSCVARHLC